MLLELVKKEQPDYVFFTLIYDEFYLKTFSAIRDVSPKTRTINFFSDDEWRFDEYSRYLAPYFDHCITTYPPAHRKAKELGLNNVELMIYACNTEVYTNRNIEKKYEVSFIGQPTKERIEMLTFLVKNGVNVSIWGKNWGLLPEFEIIKNNYKGVAEDMVEIINQSKIVLSFLKDDSNKGIQIKGRLSEVAGCGTFQILTANKETQFMLKEGKETAYFKDGEDLVNKIGYYLSHDKERESIALRAYQKIKKNYSWKTNLERYFNSLRDRVYRGSSRPLTSIRLIDVRSVVPDVKDIREEYVSFTDRDVAFVDYAGRLVHQASQDKPEIIICDSIMKHPKLGEVATLRFNSLESKSLESAPLPCVFLRTAFLRKNPALVASIVNDRKMKIDLKDQKVSKIAYPCVSFGSYPLREFAKNFLVERRFEISLYNHYYANKFGKLTGFSFRLFSFLAEDANLFILSPLLKTIQRKTRIFNPD
jgi:spore maturation protein CgeB